MSPPDQANLGSKTSDHQNVNKTLAGVITEYHASGRNSKIEKAQKTNLIDAVHVKQDAMPILASDAYPGKQIAHAPSKKSAIMFSKTESATLIRQAT
jgi:hypothetical protein